MKQRKSRIFENVTTRTLDIAFTVIVIFLIMAYVISLIYGISFISSGVDYVKENRMNHAITTEEYNSVLFATIGTGSIIIVITTVGLLVAILFFRVLIGLFYDVKMMRYNGESATSKKTATKQQGSTGNVPVSTNRQYPPSYPGSTPYPGGYINYKK